MLISSKFWLVVQKHPAFKQSYTLQGYMLLAQYETKVRLSFFKTKIKYSRSTYAKITLNVRTLLVPFSLQSIVLSNASPSIFAAVTSASHRLAKLQCSFGRNITGCWTRQLTRSKPLFWQMNTKFPWKEQIYGISLGIGLRFFTCKS